MQKQSNVKNYLKARLLERSTWLGIIGFVGSLGVAINPELAAQIASGAVALVSVVMGATPDIPAKPVADNPESAAE